MIQELTYVPVTKTKGLYYKPYRPEKLNIGGAIALFAETQEELEEVKRTCQENILHDIATTTLNDDQIAWILYASYIATSDREQQLEIQEELSKNVLREVIQNKITYKQQVIKRIVSIQQHKQQPLKPRGGVTDTEIERAKEYPIEELYDNGELFRAGKNKVGLCVFHQERTPSFYVFPDNRYKCFGCGEFGSSIDYYMKINNCSFVEAVRALNK